MKILVSLLVFAAFGAAETKLGKPFALKDPMSVEQLQAKTGQLTGKLVQVRGKVTEVCQMMGCWMALTGHATTPPIRVKVNDGEIVFPKESVGKTAIAEGKLAKLELTREQAIAHARHEAEEQGRKFDPASVKSGITIYQISGTGAVILD
jgi:hypothetical protein